MACSRALVAAATSSGWIASSRDAGGLILIPSSLTRTPHAKPVGRLRRRGVEGYAPFLVDELVDSPLQLQGLVFPGAADEGCHFD